MKKLICPKCKKVHLHSIDDKCPGCGGTDYKDFRNSDEYLRKEVEVVLEDMLTTHRQHLPQFWGADTGSGQQ